MMPKEFLQKFSADVSKRCGICQATVEVVLPAVFDQIRYMMLEAKFPCVPIDSFGTFALVQKPERRYKVHGKDEYKMLPPKKILKFQPARNFRLEIERGAFDPSRKSFTRHPDDPIIRRRQGMCYRKDRTWEKQLARGRTIDH